MCIFLSCAPFRRCTSHHSCYSVSVSFSYSLYSRHKNRGKVFFFVFKVTFIHSAYFPLFFFWMRIWPERHLHSGRHIQWSKKLGFKSVSDPSTAQTSTAGFCLLNYTSSFGRQCGPPLCGTLWCTCLTEGGRWSRHFENPTTWSVVCLLHLEDSVSFQ